MREISKAAGQPTYVWLWKVLRLDRQQGGLACPPALWRVAPCVCTISAAGPCLCLLLLLLCWLLLCWLLLLQLHAAMRAHEQAVPAQLPAVIGCFPGRQT
jgi:hypothetical protein